MAGAAGWLALAVSRFWTLEIRLQLIRVGGGRGSDK
jgi:hypothetical protein